MDKNEAIGIFDSGIGGVTVLKEILKVLPNENYIYYSDSKNNPYGDKNDKQINELCENIVKLFIKQKCKAIVIACNTASAKSEAIKDYNGINNTNALISKYGDSIDHAAGWCNNHTFKNGSKGYLGALGEWMEVFNNISDINQCITLIDATVIETTSSTHDYYTSTQFNASRAWGFNFKSEDSVASMKSMDEYIRPFAPLS